MVCLYRASGLMQDKVSVWRGGMRRRSCIGVVAFVSGKHLAFKRSPVALCMAFTFTGQRAQEEADTTQYRSVDSVNTRHTLLLGYEILLKRSDCYPTTDSALARASNTASDPPCCASEAVLGSA